MKTEFSEEWQNKEATITRKQLAEIFAHITYEFSNKIDNPMKSAVLVMLLTSFGSEVMGEIFKEDEELEVEEDE